MIAHIAALASLLVVGRCMLPSYIKVCSRKDPDLAGCIKTSVEQLRAKLEHGIPELDIPSMEPFRLDAVSFNTSSQGTHLATNVTNLMVWGASKFDILKIRPTISEKKHNFIFEVNIPQLYIQGNYEVDSRILLVEIKGNGPFNANITDYHFECLMKGHKVKRKDNNHLEFEKMDCNLVIGKTSIHLENLFEGNPVLGRATNEVINENSDVFFDEIKPNLLSSLRQKFTDIANKITLHFKYEDLFP